MGASLSQNATQLGGEVQTRLGGRLTISQITPYLNRGLSLISGAGSYSWELNITNISVTTPPPVFDLSTLSPLPDIGKAMSFNSANGLPILKADADTAGRASLNYKNVSASIFNTWSLISGTNLPAKVRFDPVLPAGTYTIQISYHAAPTALDSNNPAIVTPWADTWLDDLVIDYAEAEIKRILNWAEWDSLEKRFQAKLRDALSTFSSQRESTGPAQEQAMSTADEQATGRS